MFCYSPPFFNIRYSVASEEFSNEMSRLTEEVKNGKISVDEFVKQVNELAKNEHKVTAELQTALEEQKKAHVSPFFKTII